MAGYLYTGGTQWTFIKGSKRPILWSLGWVILLMINVVSDNGDKANYMATVLCVLVS